MIRLTGGEFRGRKLITPAAATTHPMGERERLALFNMISARLSLNGALVLDAYAGSGALGLEALSRGAEKVWFAENQREALQCIQKNIFALGVEKKAVTSPVKVQNFGQLEPQARLFNLILIDPPYDNFKKTEFLHLENLLLDNGILALSHPHSINPTEIFSTKMQLVASKKYAAAQLSLFTKN